MEIQLIVVGKLKNTSLRALQEDFCKRISRSLKFELVVLRDSNMLEEGSKISKTLKRHERCRTYGLAVEGKQLDSRQFSGLLDSDYSGVLKFVIGGPYGLADAVKQECQQLISLSSMTFTHEFARVILLEQIYRGLEIRRGSGYHH